MKKLLLLIFLLLIFQNSQAQKSFDKLSLQEKIGQTLFVYADTNTAEQIKDAIQKGLVGGVLIQWGNYSREETKKLINTLQSWAKQSPNKLPLLIAVDYEGGTVYSPSTLGLPYLPSNMVIAAANDYENTQAFAFAIAQELKDLGIHINFAPVMDVNSNPQNPIIGVRSFGNNKETVALMGKAIIKGLQQGGIVAVAKHFPGHGDASLDTHLSLTVFEGTKEELFNTHIYPFQKAIEAGVKGIMSSHIRYPFLDNKLATYSKIILTDLLRKELNFKGIIFTDSLDMKGALLKDISKAASLSIKAGADVALIAKEPPQKAINAIQKRVSKERIEDASAKIYNLKKELKLFEENQNTKNNGAANKAIEVLSKEITQEAITLVKNEENLIPYKPTKQNPKLCAVFFAPTRMANKLPDFIQPFLNNNFEVSYYNAPLVPKIKDIQRAKKCMQNADITILGSLQWANKEIKSQKQAIDNLMQNNKNIILLSLMSPYDIKNYPKAKTVLALYGINTFSASNAASIILGEIAPKGHLPISL